MSQADYPGTEFRDKYRHTDMLEELTHQLTLLILMRLQDQRNVDDDAFRQIIADVISSETRSMKMPSMRSANWLWESSIPCAVSIYCSR